MRLQNNEDQVKSGTVSPDLLHPSAISRTPGALRPLKAHQRLAHHEQIGQRASDEESIGVLGYAPITHLGKAEDAFDHPEGMFHLGAHTRFTLVRHRLVFSQLMRARASTIGKANGWLSWTLAGVTTAE
jgi:hypothetical protein